jgi:hypothetical protein
MVSQLNRVNDLIEVRANATHHVLVLPVFSQQPLNLACNSQYTCPVRITMSQIVC